MGRRALELVACMLVRASVAVADSDPQPTPAQPEVSWYGSAKPVAEPTSARVRHTVLRGGAFVLGGLTYVDATVYGRIDLGVPAPLRRLPQLRAALVSETSAGTDSDQTLRRTLVLTPTAQYEWHLPFQPKRGEILLIIAAGLRRSQLWVKKPEEPFWPSQWESTTAYAVRLTPGLEYRAFSGLIVSFQPSVGFPLNTPDPPDARWMTTTPERDLGVSLVAGYQFQ
jgi:hypothetical protein